MIKTKPKNWEHIDQTNLFKRLSPLEIEYPQLKNIFAIPNGGSRGGNSLQRKINGKQLKNEGVKKGVPDIFVAIPNKKYHGLFIEMKHGQNKTSVEQKEWIKRLNKAGYLAVVCYGTDEAFNAILEYTGIILS